MNITPRLLSPVRPHATFLLPLGDILSSSQFLVFHRSYCGVPLLHLTLSSGHETFTKRCENNALRRVRPSPDAWAPVPWSFDFNTSLFHDQNLAVTTSSYSDATSGPSLSFKALTMASTSPFFVRKYDPVARTIHPRAGFPQSTNSRHTSRHESRSRTHRRSLLHLLVYTSIAISQAGSNG